MAFIDEILDEQATAKRQPEASYDVGVLDEMIAAPGNVESTVRTNLSLASELNPEHETKVHDLSMRSGHSSATVRANPDKVEKQLNAYPGGNERLDNYYAAHPSNAAISSDDWDPILTVHKTIEENRGKPTGTIERLRTERPKLTDLLLKAPLAAFASGVAEIPATVGRLSDLLKPVFTDPKKLEAFYAQKPEPVTLSKDLKAWLRSQYGDTKAEELVGSAFESMGTMVALLATGGSSSVLYGMSSVAGVRKTTEARAGGATMTQAVLAGAVSAGVEYWTEKIPVAEMFDPAKGFLEKLYKGGAFDLVGEAIATATEMWLIDQEILGGEHKTLEEYKQALIDTAIVSLIMTSTTTTVTHPFVREGATPGAPTAPDTLEAGFPSHITGVPTEAAIDAAPKARQLMTEPEVVEFNKLVVENQKANLADNQKALEDNDKLKKSIDETKTAERSRDHTKELLKELKQSDEDVFVSNEFWDNYFAQSTIEEQDALLDKLVVSQAQVSESRATGNDITVKANDMLTLAPDEYATIKDDWKPSPGSYTQREITDQRATDDIDNTQALLDEKVDQEKAVNVEVARIDKEIGALKLPDTKFAGDATILLKGIAERLQSYGADPVQKLKDISFKRTPFKDFIARGKALFQAPTPTAEALSQQIATLSVRLDKIRPEQQGAADLTKRLNKQLTDAKEKLRATAEANFDVLFQATQKKGVPPRGVLTLEGEVKIIELFEGADLSTILHEIGHIALLEYTSLERTGEASESLKKDMSTLRKWVGAAEGADFNRVQSEQIARGMELYLREGKAPTSALRAAFERLKSYMMSVYTTAKELNVTLNKDVRRVFDRMIAANLAVENALVNGEFTIKTDKEMTALGVSPADKSFAKRLVDQIHKKAEELLTRARNKGLVGLRKDWREEAYFEVLGENKVYDIVDDLLQTYNKDQLNVMREDIDLGEKAQRIPKRDAEGNIIEWIVIGGTFPDYFTGRGFDKKYALNIIDKVLRGESLTDLQAESLDILVEGHKDEIRRQAEKVGYEADVPLYDTDLRFDLAEFIEEYGRDALDDLPNTDIMIEGGVPIAKTAAAYEYDDSAAFIQALFDTPPFNDAIDTRVSEKQVEHDASFVLEDYVVNLPDYRKYLELMGRYVTNQGVGEADIDAGIQRNIKRWEKQSAKEVSAENPELSGNDLQLAIDERVQEKIAAFQDKKRKLGGISTDALKKLAKDTMSAKLIKDARSVNQYLSAMKRASNDERRAIMRKDWGAASDANELARFNYEMAGLSVKARDNIKTVLARANRIGKSKTIEDTYSEAILHLIDRFKLGALTPKNPGVAPDYTTLFAGDIFGYSTFPRPDFLDSKIADYNNLRMDQLKELDNAIRYLEGQGRVGKDKTLTTGELVQDVTDRAAQDVIGKKKVYEDGTTIQKVVGKSRAFYATSDRMQNIMIAVGGYQNVGAKGESSYIETQTVDRIFEADNNEVLMHDKVRAGLEPHFKTIQIAIRDMVRANRKVAGELRGHKIEIPGVPVPQKLQNRGAQPNWWTPEQIFSVALNQGNPGNANRVISGYPGLTVEQVGLILDKLSLEDMRAVQGVWDVMKGLYDDMDAVFFKLNNYHLDKIEIEQFSFKGETFDGGYYPAVYDGRLSKVVATREEAIKIGKNENAKFQNPYLKSSFTRGRTEGGSLPIRLRLNVINAHFRDAVHYITHAEVVKDIDMIIQNETFEDVVTDALGKDVYQAIRPSLAHVASPKIAGMQSVENRLIERHRRLASAYMILANAGVVVKQTFSFGGGVHDVGLKNAINGVGQTMKNPHKAYQTMMDLSPRMRDRKNNFDREFATLFSSFSPEQKTLWFGNRNITAKDAKAILGWGVRFADTFTVTPLWTGAFEGRLKENNQNVGEAVTYADNKIRKSQPSAAPIDLPYLQRTGGFLRTIVNFQTFWLKYAERQRLHFNAMRVGALSKSDYAWFTLIETVAPAIGSHMLMSLIWGRDLEEEDVQSDILKDAFMQMFIQAVPLASGFFNPYGDPFNSPVFEGLVISRDTFIGVGKWIAGDISRKEKERLEERILWDTLSMASFFSGVPVSQIAKKIVKGQKQKKGLPVVKHLIPAPKNKQ